MATTTPDYTRPERRIAERRRSFFLGFWGPNAFRVSWAGIWAGVLASLGVLLLLAPLGIAIGVTATDFRNPNGSALGIGALVWTAVSLLVAMFIGGMLSTRLSLIADRSTGLWEGALVWVLSTTFVLYLAGSGVGMLASGTSSLIGGVGNVATVATATNDIDFSQQNVDQLVARLQDPQTARQLAAATGLPMSQVQDTLARSAQAILNARDNPEAAIAQARRSFSDMMAHAPTVQRIETVSRASAWGSFIALVVSLCASLLGAAVGRRRAGMLQVGT